MTDTTSPTAGWRLHHTMMRAKDPEKTKHFYVDLMGMTQIMKKDFEWGNFSLYFFAYLQPGEKVPTFSSPEDELAYVFSLRTHCVEITHNWGTESDANFAGYHTGNTEPRGFGHIAVVVPNVEAAIARLEAAGVNIVKRPDGGKIKGIAFVADPDGYWVEILPEGWRGS
jgi:lactoylglutathione lyase